MVGIQKEGPPEIKAGMLEKRSRNKSVFTKENYKTRVLVLDTLTLRWFSGTIKDRGQERGFIDLVTVLVVEVVEDSLLGGKHNAMQVVYKYSKDKEPFTLYMVAPSKNARDAWVSAIRAESMKNDANLLGYYHKGVYVPKEGYNCCNSMDKTVPGCVKSIHTVHLVAGPHTPTNLSLASLGSGHHVRLSTLLVDTMVKRSQGKSIFFTRTNFKRRTFVLDANSLRYYDGDTRMKSNERGRIHLSCVVTVEPVEIAEDTKGDAAFQVGYYDEYDLLHLYVIASNKESRDTWVKTAKREAIKSGAEFLPSYHIGIWSRDTKYWPCCQDSNKHCGGCRRVIMQPEMKLCSSDLNVSATASHRLKSPHELKVGCMMKRSQNKSTFFSSDNYQKRVFTLDHECLAFYTGYLEDRGELKCTIPLVEMWSVENIQDGMLDERKNVFQVLYFEDDQLYHLYIVAGTDQERNSWVTAIKKEAARSNVWLQPRYHPGVWLKKTRKYNCCGRVPKDSPGCTDVCGMSLVSVRDRLNTMDSMKGIRHRLGTLDSVPEINESPLTPKITPKLPRTIHPAPPGGHIVPQQKSSNLPMSPATIESTKNNKPLDETTTKETKDKKGKLPEEPKIVKEEKSTVSKPKPKPDVVPTSPPNPPGIPDREWTRGMTNMSTTTMSTRPPGSGYQMQRNRSQVYTSSDASRQSSRQPSFMSHSQYSEDFESVSEVEM